MVTKITLVNDCASDVLSWTPIPGREFSRYISGKPNDMASRLSKDCVSILSAGIQPGKIGSRVGLVIGKVQSGKTSSFTGVTALAVDSGYKIIVIIAGTTQLLVNQTTARLETDLGANAPGRWNEIRVFKASTNAVGGVGDSERSALKDALKNYSAGRRPDSEQPCLIVVVMKNRVHLDRLYSIFKDVASSKGRANLDFSAIIIDDEAHMHSPNVAKDGGTSAIYSEIRRLCSMFSSRTLLQYTATPQANLLMEIADELSPDYVRLLEPGEGYVGGSELFLQKKEIFVRPIDEAEVSPNPPPDSPIPLSLRRSISSYLLGCAARSLDGATRENLSLLVHSDVRTAVHKIYERWIKDYIEHIKLVDGHDDEGGVALPAEIIWAWDDLKKSNPDLPDISTCFREITRILTLIGIRVETLNNLGQIGRVNYNSHPYFIVNGGTMLGVGYTVEGLMTTHMIRSSGTGLADSIQQRGRFFGYLGRKKQLVRVWLTEGLSDCFTDYATHEERLRTSLFEYDSSRPEFNPNLGGLKGWKRLFWLSDSMKLTRKSAQKLELQRYSLDSSGWATQSYPVGEFSDGQLENIILKITDHVRSHSGFKQSKGWGGGDESYSTSHSVGEASLKSVLSWLAELPFASDDGNKFLIVRLSLSEYLENNSSSIADVIVMGRGTKSGFLREREISNGKIDLFQGKSTSRGGYKGDRAVHFADRVTLQLHPLQVYKEGSSSRRQTWAVAVYFPKNIQRIAENFLVEV